ncbi:MAG: DUF4132 domain-containing protein [Tannerellaceae bacterium]|jgi:hypothetical protein|nr:DUF4132 domain-containing protein [Tannerellaceae bacterium]
MDKEKMIELWKKQFEQSYYQWNLSPLVYDYFEEKVDTITNPSLSGEKYYTYYEDWMVKELDGENAELARRMLVVISKIRNSGPISSAWNVGREAEICLRIGYDFESILKETIHKYKDISADETFHLAKLLHQYLHEDAQKFASRLLDGGFASRLLGKGLEELIAKRKSTREIYVAVYVAIHLLREDAKKYAAYLPVLANVANRIGDGYIVMMLYHSWTLSEKLKSILVSKLVSSTQTARVINACMKGKEFLSFLGELGAPQWPYYFLVAVEAIRDVDRPAVLNELYQVDHATFMEVYNQLATTNNPQEFVYAPYLLAIMLKNGEELTEPEKTGVILLGTFKRLLNEYMDDKNVDFAEIADKSVALEETPTTLSFNRKFEWRNGELLIGALAVLYNYAPHAHRFINYLLYYGNRRKNNFNERDYTAGYFMKARKRWLDIPACDSFNTLLASEGGYSIGQAFSTYVYAQVYASDMRDVMGDVVNTELIRQNEPVALAILTNGSLSIEETLAWTNLLYETCGVTVYQPLITLLSNKSKLIRKKAEELIAVNESGIRPLLEESMPQKGDALAASKRLIKRWDNERKYGADFSFKDNQTVTDYCNDNYDPTNEKHIHWIPEDMFTCARFADLEEKAPAVVIKYILSEYMALEEPYKIKICDKVVEALHPQDFEATLENIYKLWLDNGAETKKKMFMLPYCIYGSDSQILKLRSQLLTWAESARGAIAAFVVNAIAMNGGSVALMMIDGISVKFPNNQVKNAANAAFTFAAKALEIPEDELSDKIVPTLGFNKEGEKTADYGSRTFRITLMPDFSLTLYDNKKQKVVKSLPAPTTSDDAVKVENAKKEFTELKKQIKATVQAQTNRLEKVLMNGRKWDVGVWNNLFVENPIMHRFATGLVWGVYNNHTLTDTFRYMDDGTFNTLDEEEYTLPDSAAISLIHPIELSEDTLAQWKEQLDDYEVIQPLSQLTSPIVKLEEKDVKEKAIIRYAGNIAPSGKIAGIAKKYNMERGSVWDGGSYTCFHWVDKFLNMAVQLNFEYMYMGQGYDEDVTLGDVIIYRLSENQETDDEPKDNAIISPTEVPARFLSSILGIFDVFIEK